MATLASLTSFKEGDRRKVIRSGSRFEHWKKLFLGGFNSMFVLNLIGLIGLAPVLFLFYRYFSSIWQTASLLPFGSSVGTGILTVVDTASIKHITSQAILLENMMLMPLAIIISSIFVSPFFYAMRNAEYDGVVSGYKSCLKGLKYCGVKFGILGFFTAVIVEIALWGYYFTCELAFGGLGMVAQIAIYVAIIIFLVIALTVMIYAYVLTVTYKMSIGGAMKRAFKFTCNLPLQNLCMFIATIAPFFLAFAGSFILSLVVTLGIFVGFSYMMSIWMVYIQTVLTAATPQSAKKGK